MFNMMMNMMVRIGIIMINAFGKIVFYLGAVLWDSGSEYFREKREQRDQESIQPMVEQDKVVAIEMSAQESSYDALADARQARERYSSVL